MTDVKVEQCDRILFSFLLGWDVTDNLQRILDGHFDQHVKMQKIARHRQAAEKATRERDAGIAEAHRQARLEAAKNAISRKAKAEARDHESMAIEALHIATAIRSQNDG